MSCTGRGNAFIRVREERMRYLVEGWVALSIRGYNQLMRSLQGAHWG